ncbi:Asp23/Gls24 family envelope stress response protein [Lacticaseibacillus hulanensis]|uniref:Asp23/Gls24 family envelope stress response protein n=1 Tax=Lacticaseibacillus hulanensis TaxID=2493111 RepID=UPI000FD9E779|nr:Asp23/Gls24 family envelope stress response protein [Lacticaseibacillus hulanensis]
MQTLVGNDVAQLRASSQLTFSDQVLAKIARICAAEVDGILGMDGNVIDSIAESLGKDERTMKGINAEVGEKQVAIDMNLILAFDANAQDVFDELCDRISKAVRQMTGLHLVELNVHIQDVLTTREWRAVSN